MTEAEKRAKAKYKREKTKRFYLEFTPLNMDLYDHLQKQPNKQAYVKDLIRKDMNK